MHSRPLLLLFVLNSTLPLSFAASVDFPVLQIGFCLNNYPIAESCYAIKSNSTLHFGDIQSTNLFYSEGSRPIIASCISTEPLRWILQTGTDTPAQLMESSITEHSTGCCATYSYRIYFPQKVKGVIRCESYENSSRAAEVYVAKENTDQTYAYPEYMILPFLVTAPRDSFHNNSSSGLIVPCVLKEFSSAMTNYNHLTITVAPREKILIKNITSECIECFPGPAIYFAEKCMTCNNFQLSKNYGVETESEYEMEISAQRKQLSFNQSSPSSSTGDFTRCVTNDECYERAIIAESTADKGSSSCPNPDHVFTCTDAYNSVSDYPPSCEATDILNQNFKQVEACMMQEHGTTLEGLEYDPRIGFRLKKKSEYENVVFKCPAMGRQWSSIYLTPYYHNTAESQTGSRAMLNKYSPIELGKREGKITCSIRAGFQHGDKLDLILIECFPLTDCELKLRLDRGYIMAGQSDETLRLSSSTRTESDGTVVRELMPNGVKHGVAICGFPHFPQPHDVNFGNEIGYFSTGPDHKPYLSKMDPKANNFVSTNALVDFKLDSKYGGIGTILKVKCTVSTFFIFPELKLTIHALNGMIADKGHQAVLLDTDPGEFTFGRTWYFVVPENFTKATCTAPFRNSSKWLNVSLRLDEILSSDSDVPFPTYWVIIIVSAVLLFVVSTVCVIWASLKYRRAKEIRKLTREEIDEFFHGNKKAEVDMTAGEIDVNSIAFPAKYHVLAEELKLDLSSKLGEGEFGYCVKGEYKGEVVAVKAAKDTADMVTFKEFLREVKIMAYIGSHENIVGFIGAQVSQIGQRMCKAVLELSPYGDLLSYLRGSTLTNKSDANTRVGETIRVACVSGNGDQLDLGRTDRLLDFNRLCYFCEQIANGMEFLAEKRVIHGDLAARNVLVFQDFRVKLTDFGLSRKLYASENYMKKQGKPLPWRWMAIESLKYMQFSTMSDVWSFGVTAWEVFTLGQVPHSGYKWSCDFEEQLENGMRLRKPEGLPDHVYQFMLTLWAIEPTARPSFLVAKRFFESIRNGQ